MADFFQHAQLPTLHHLAPARFEETELQLEGWTRDRAVTLLLPALFAECERPAFPRILQEVSETPFVKEVVVTMNGLMPSQLQTATEFLRSHLRGKTACLLWNDGPDLAQLWSTLEKNGCPRYQPGKGSNIWMGLAWLLSGDHSGLVLSHDTDILNYSRQLLWKLAFPLAHPDMGYRFAKGYYSRVSDRLYGRVTRLLIFPLIQSVADLQPITPMVEHLRSFRYPLSGEFGGDMTLLGGFALPSGWGLEMTMLAEVQRQLAVAQVCQVDLGFHFEHRHRAFKSGGARAEGGLMAASMEVARCLLYQVTLGQSRGEVRGLLDQILPVYRERASEWARRYHHVSLVNGLSHDLEAELDTVSAFAESLSTLISAPDDLALQQPNLRPSPRSVLDQHPQLKAVFRQAAIRLD